MKNWYAVLPVAGALLLTTACADTPTAVSGGGAAPTARATGAVAGAGFTSTNVEYDGTGHCKNGPGDVNSNNCNIYDAKEHVWIDGGPISASLGDGTFFFAVLVPGGQTNDVNDGQGGGVSANRNLSDDVDAYTLRAFTISGGVITAMVDPSSTHLLDNGRIRLFEYLDTTNPGGEYDVAVCKISPPKSYPVTGSDCKYDNFKVRAGDILTQYGTLTVDKFYDANANGVRDGGEILLTGWNMTLNPGAWTLPTPASFTTLDPGTYSVTEGVPTGAGQAASWFITYKGGSSGLLADNLLGGSAIRLSTATASDLTIPGIEVVASSAESRLFGNVCLGAGGGLTLGYWSNKNGQATMNDGNSSVSELAMLAGLNLRNANGSNFDPTTYTQFRTWLLNATATNMAYMLSAQLSAMELNVEAGFVGGGSVIYAPGTTSANPLGFATIGGVMAEANTELGLHGLTTDGSPYRSYQESLKNALDAANNNLNFVRGSPCAFTF